MANELHVMFGDEEDELTNEVVLKKEFAAIPRTFPSQSVIVRGGHQYETMVGRLLVQVEVDRSNYLRQLSMQGK